MHRAFGQLPAELGDKREVEHFSKGSFLTLVSDISDLHSTEVSPFMSIRLARVALIKQHNLNLWEVAKNRQSPGTAREWWLGQDMQEDEEVSWGFRAHQLSQETVDAP